MQVESNFSVWLEEDGTVVPGSQRCGHNVFTEFGRTWLQQLIAWAIVGDLSSIHDSSTENRRLRWLGMGTGTQLELTNVSALAAPVAVTTGPNVFLRQLGTRTHPVFSSAKYATTFTGASSDFDYVGASVTVSEAGIFADVNSGGGPGLDTSIGTNTPVAYKAFSPLTKLAAQNLIVTWEFRF